MATIVRFWPVTYILTDQWLLWRQLYTDRWFQVIATDSLAKWKWRVVRVIPITTHVNFCMRFGVLVLGLITKKRQIAHLQLSHYRQLWRKRPAATTNRTCVRQNFKPYAWKPKNANCSVMLRLSAQAAEKARSNRQPFAYRKCGEATTSGIKTGTSRSCSSCCSHNAQTSILSKFQLNRCRKIHVWIWVSMIN